MQNITREGLGKTEATFLSQIGGHSTFSIKEARKILEHKQSDPTPQFLDRLERKGWIRQIKRGIFAIIPLSSGEARTPQLHEFLVAMNLVSPAAIAYWSALNHHGMTEQLPRTVFVATNHRANHTHRESLDMTFRIVSIRPSKYFGVIQDWIDDQSFWITDKEKTIIDGLDLPEYVGGVGEIAKALPSAWNELDEKKLRKYAAKIGNSAVTKRLGFLMESLGLGDPEALRKAVPIASGFSPLDPTIHKKGKYNRRWGLLLNAEVTSE